MAQVTLKGSTIETTGHLPKVGSAAPNFTLVNGSLGDVQLSNYAGSKLLLNIFPSIDTGTCAMSVRTFNERAASLDGVKVLCVSMDLPFALARFCGAEGIENVEAASGFRSSFGSDYGLVFTSGPLTGLYSRSVVVLNEAGKVLYTEQVAETTEEPNYDSALHVL